MQQRLAPYRQALRNWRVSTKLLVAMALVTVLVPSFWLFRASRTAV